MRILPVVELVWIVGVKVGEVEVVRKEVRVRSSFQQGKKRLVERKVERWWTQEKSWEVALVGGGTLTGGELSEGGGGGGCRARTSASSRSSSFFRFGGMEREPFTPCVSTVTTKLTCG